MDQQDLIRKFEEVTGLDDSQSRFYLESHQWNVELAASFYFTEKVFSSSMSKSTPPVLPSNPENVSSSSNVKPNKPSTRNLGVKGLSDFQDEKSDEDNNINWYTGGEKSGIQVQAPKKSIADQVFQRAIEIGGKSISEQHELDRASFTGLGYRLGQDATGSSIANQGARKELRHKIILWRNGFTVDDASLRDYNDPKNAEFLGDIQKGVVPKELNVGHRQEIDIELINKKEEDFKVSTGLRNPFSGPGQILSGTATTMIPSTKGNTSIDRKAIEPPLVDESLPVTSVQIRLQDGSRIVGRFNHSHTISDIRQFLDATRPCKFAYQLMTSFPQKVFLDESQTIASAGLANAMVIQKPL